MARGIEQVAERYDLSSIHVLFNTRTEWKALQDAGLDMKSGDLNYNLKGQEDGKQQQTASGSSGGEAGEDDTLESDVMDTAVAAHEMGILHNGRVDVRA